MARELTPHAAAAKEIRQYLKRLGVKARVKSRIASMMNAVDIYVKDIPPDKLKEITDHCNQHQYGHFNGMEDIYEYSNRRDDITQVKYVSVHNEYSDDIKQDAWSYIRDKFAGADDLPALYSELSSTARLFDEWATTIVWRVLNGSMGEYWQTRPATPTPEATNTVTATGATIEEHTHTKKGFQMFIAIMPGRVERAEYLQLLDKAKSLNGWYSRKWGTTPAGFAFKDQASALEFVGEIGTSTGTEQPARKADHSKKLRSLADRLTTQIENKLADRLTNTPKRLAQANHSRLEGERLQRTQQALYALADLHEAGTVPPVLEKITSKSAVYDLMGTIKNPVQNGYHTYQACTGEQHHQTPEATALWSLITGKSEEEKKQDELRRKVDGLQFSKIPGYFPTPEPIVKKMIEYADIEAGMQVLEPSAGSGAIVKEIVDNIDTEVLAIESNYTLADILKESGFPTYRLQVRQRDFLECNGEYGKFDRILMNPPFENGADIKHIKHAITMLRPGGRLVAICAGGPKQEKELQPISDHWEELPQGSFKGQGTNVNTALMVINA